MAEHLAFPEQIWNQWQVDVQTVFLQVKKIIDYVSSSSPDETVNTNAWPPAYTHQHPGTISTQVECAKATSGGNSTNLFDKPAFPNATTSKEAFSDDYSPDAIAAACKKGNDRIHEFSERGVHHFIDTNDKAFGGNINRVLESPGFLQVLSIFGGDFCVNVNQSTRAITYVNHPWGQSGNSRKREDYRGRAARLEESTIRSLACEVASHTHGTLHPW